VIKKKDVVAVWIDLKEVYTRTMKDSNVSLTAKDNEQLYQLFIHSRHRTKEIKHTWVNPKVNDITVSHNKACEICTKFFTDTCLIIPCIYCNVICHINCLQKYKKIDEKDTKSWVCFYCEDSFAYDLSLHERATHAEQYRQLIYASQLMISKHWRRYSQRLWYIRIYSAIVRLQIQFQVRKRKRQFLHSVQAKLRTIKCRVTSLLQLALFDREAKAINTNAATSTSTTTSSAASLSSPTSKITKVRKREYLIYIIVTVYDLMQGNSIQTWRMESPVIVVKVLPNTLADVLLDEKFVLGGVSGFQHVVISLFQRGAVRDIFLGQVSIELATNSYWKKGGKFHLPLLECGYELKDVAGMDMKADFRLKPSGFISFEIVTSHGMNSECCSCFSTTPEEIIRSVAKLADHPGVFVPLKKVILVGGKLNPLASPGHGGGSSDVSVASSAIASSSVGGGSSVGGSVEASGLSLKKNWIAVTEGKLYVFGHFGDQLKMTLDLQHFSVSFDFSKGNKIIYKLYRLGYPEFQFYPVYDHEIFRFKCAFLSSVRLAKGFAFSGTGNTISNHAQPFRPQVGTMTRDRSTSDLSTDTGAVVAVPPPSNIGDRFDVNYLVSDLLALEILKSKKTAFREAASFSLLNNHMVQNGGKKGKNSKMPSIAVLPAGVGTRNSIMLSPIKHKSGLSSKISPQRNNNFLASCSDEELFHCSNDSDDLNPRFKRLSVEMKEKKIDKLDKPIPAFPPRRGSILRSSLGENALKGLDISQIKVYQDMKSEIEKTKDIKMSEIKDQIIEEMAIDDLATDEKYQNVGEFFIKNLITDAAEQKVNSHFTKEPKVHSDSP
jgi:hypothetical protein